MSEPRAWGMLAEFETPQRLVEAARAVRARGHLHVDAYTPFPVEGLADALGIRPTRLPAIVLVGAVVGAALGFWLQYWVSVIEYPMNVGGKPDNSWPAFVPIMFETSVLCAALAAVLGMLAANGLPEPYHPLFGVEAFQFATRDRFFLSIAASDPAFDRDAVRELIESLRPVAIEEVPS